MFSFEKLKIYKEIVTDPESHCGKTVPIPCPKHKHIKHTYMEAVCSEVWNRSLGFKKNQLPTPCVTLGKSFNTLILQLSNCVAKKSDWRGLVKVIDWLLLAKPAEMPLGKELNCMCLKNQCILLHYYWNNGKYIVKKKNEEKRNRKIVADQFAEGELDAVQYTWSCSSKVKESRMRPFCKKGSEAQGSEHPELGTLTLEGLSWDLPI